MTRILSGVAIVTVIGTGAFVGMQLSRTKVIQVTTNGPNASLPPPVRPTPSGKILPPVGNRVYWGAFRLGAPYRTGLVASLEEEVGRRPAVLMWYQEWEGRPSFPLREASWLFERGIVPVISWEPWRPPDIFGTIVNNQPKYRLSRIADGAWDSYLERYARQIKYYGGPVMLRPMHEMDGFWYPWAGTQNGNTPEDYVRAWRHIHDLFEEVGATNVTWVWSVNHVSVPDVPENAIENYWPGDRYVDWVGFSGFNWGTASPLSVWKGFDSVQLERYEELLAFHKPVALMEMGAPEVGGDKAEWIRDSFAAVFDHYHRLKLLIWYDKRDTPQRDWRIDSSPAALDAFREVIADPRVLEANAAQATALDQG